MESCVRLIWVWRRVDCIVDDVEAENRNLATFNLHQKLRKALQKFYQNREGVASLPESLWK